jgi:hypothetical protein
MIRKHIKPNWIDIPPELLAIGHGVNINNNIIKLYHSSLKNFNEDSFYRKECPFCDGGVFCVKRNLQTLELEKLDRCLKCGQQVEYLDYEQTLKGK